MGELLLSSKCSIKNIRNGGRYLNISENIKMAFSSLRAHKLRSMLTMFGIIIGVGSIITIIAIGQGGETVLKSKFTGGSNTIELFYMPTDEELEANPAILYEDAFTSKDITLIENIPEVEKIVATSSESSSIRYIEETSDAIVIGINQGYLDVEGLDINKGRYLVAADFIEGSRVAIVSESLKDNLLEDKNEELLGKVVYIGEQPVEIVGVIGEDDGIFSPSSDIIYVPMKTWQNVFLKTDITELSIRSSDPEKLQIAGEKAADLLNQVHETDDAYQILNIEEIAEGIGMITRIMTIVISSIAGISLLVGGIGVMNIMLVSVTERTREIGIRISLGATRGQILFQFLIESITLTLMGGVIGIGVGTGVALIISYFVGFPLLVSFPVVIGGVVFSMVIGIIFGLLPANKASQLNPIEALHYE